MIRYAAFGNFLWLWLVPALAALLAFSVWQRGRVMAAFLGSSSVKRLAVELSFPRLVSKALCVVVAVGLIVFALAQPQWGKYWSRQRAAGRDVIVALDVSRSMLAEDVVPSRLERAKADVRDLVNAVEESPGHRLGLIAFAGSPSLKCPLTQVTSHFKLVLDAIDPRSVPQGGTMIGDCIREAIEAFDDKTQNFRDLILISDGEDMDSFPAEAATAAQEAGITIYTIGVGDPDQGSRIPVTDKNGRRSYLEHQGEVVWSKLNENSLKEIAQKTGGIYIPAGTRAIELDRIFRDVIEPKTKREMDETRRERLHHRFQWFLAPAILLIMLEMLIRDTRTRAGKLGSQVGVREGDSPSGDSASSRAHGRHSLLPTAVLALAILVPSGVFAQERGRESFLYHRKPVQVVLARQKRLPTPLSAKDAGSLVRQGNMLYEQGKFVEASEKFAEAARLAPTSPIPLFNQASALFQSGDFDGAAKLYEQARIYAPDDLRQQISYALGNCHLQQAMQAQSQPNSAAQQAKQATQFYRDAIGAKPRTEADPISDAARYNLEIAKRLIQLAEQKQQEQKQHEQNQQQQQGQGKDKSEGPTQDKQQEQQGENEGTQQESKGKQEKQADDSQSKDGSKDQEQEQGQQAEPDNQQVDRAGQSSDKLSPDDANDLLRAAIARAQAARSRRLSEQNKQLKAKPVAKDW